MFRKTILILFPLLILLILLGGTLVVSGSPTTESLTTPNPTPAYQRDPIGIEIPLGRYSEPATLLLESERVASAPSVLNSAAPTMKTNFDGIGMEVYGGGYVSSPPDTHSATGPDRIIEVTNGHVAIYNKSGGLIAGGDTGVGAVSLNDFCGSAGPPTEDGCYDPKIIYDQASDRFVAVVLQGKTAVTSILHVMVSKTSTPANLTSDWDKFSHSASANIGGTDGWFDYPGLGVSPDAVVVTGNIFPDGGGLPLGTKTRVFDKIELYDGDVTATYQDINDSIATSGLFTIQPAHHLSTPPPETFYLLARLGPTNLAVLALTGVPASLSGNVTLVTTLDQGTCVATAPQMGTSKEIVTVCPRMMNAVWRDGSLWGALTGSDAADSRAVVQWFEIETNGYPSGTPSLRQHGAIDAGTGEYTFMPSISVDAYDNAAIAYSQSSSNRYPEMRYTGRAASDALNTMRDPVVAKTSVGFYDDYGDSPERWGDYSSTVVDPADGSFWISNEYVKVAPSGGGDNGRWGTWHANFTFQASSASGSTVWVQSNESGFDDAQNEAILSLTPFNGELWAGTYNSVSGNGFQLWRLNSSGEWYPEWEGDSSYANTVGISDMIVVSDVLFTGSWNETEGGSVFAYDGTDWFPVSDFGFGDPNNTQVVRFAAFGDVLYAGTVNETGGEIWRCQICDGSDWEQVADAGFGDANNQVVPSFAVFDNMLYAGTINFATGGEVWSSTTGNAGTWSQVNSDGFGTANNLAISALAVFNNALYASTAAGNADFGAQVWRCQVCDGSDWSSVVDDGFGDMDTNDMSALEVFDEKLYFVVGNLASGLQVWRTADGTNWAQVGFAGFGDANNRAPTSDKSVAVYNGNLYVGTENLTDGGEVWLYLDETVYLPVTVKND